MTDLSISLLSFNTKELLENCLNSIIKNTKSITYEILLVDNGSKDGSAQMVKQKFPQVKLVASRQNKLYIKGHNQNLRRVKGRYFLILNEDTEIGPGVLEKMVKFMDQNKEIGLTSCRQINENGKTDTTCSRFPTPIVELLESSPIFKRLSHPLCQYCQNLLNKYRYKGWNRKSTKSVDVLPGSFIIGRKELLEKIGYFDEDLLFFYGEADFCQRAKNAGYQVYHKGDVVFTHFGSKGLSKLTSSKRYQLAEHDILVYYKKYFGALSWLILWLFLKTNWLYMKVRYSPS
ncbi:glycosyltransferase family 2 protein [Candidatus Curtissbacteria bacterium]|nr:glycosyltransferase family 2 protein [Candidatus Curtissbacteria bacterium]